MNCTVQMKNRPSSVAHRQWRAFTLVEVAVAIVVIALVVGTATVILDNLVGAMLDIRLQTDAFETVRQNMETLLSLPRVQDTVEYGVSEIYPEIQWQTVIEPFYEPITNAMWLRAICSAGYTDSKGQYQEVELEHWLTNLPGNVVRQILQQQRAEEEYLDLLSGTASGQAEAALQETTIAYLEQAGLDVDAYTSFIERQRRRKLDYIAQKGFDDGYFDFLEELRQEENRFLEGLGMDFDKYNIFADTYVPDGAGWDDPAASEASGSDALGPDPFDNPTGLGESPADGADPHSEQPKKIYTPDDLPKMGIPEEYIPVFLPLFNS